MTVATIPNAGTPETARKRRWRIPPPPLEDGDSPGPEGLSILDEIEGELGVVLWKSLRSVLLWADTDHASRRKLFDANLADRRYAEISAVVPPNDVKVGRALEDLLSVLANPHSADPEFVGGACQRAAEWAAERQSPRTQLEFLQAAAACCPNRVGFALAIGGVTRDLAHYARAEAWLYRAVGLARTSEDWPSYVTAYLRHGIMMYRRGALPAARRSLLKALRRSRRQGLRDGEGRALHNLSSVEFRAGAFREAMEYVARAVEAYGPCDERLPRLAHDAAYYWLELGHYEHSFPVFLATLERVGESDRASVLGSLGRAAAGLGDVAAYQWAFSELQEYAPAPGIAEAWVDMAKAALVLGRRSEALEAAGLAESVARSRREGLMMFLAEEVMDRIQNERLPHRKNRSLPAESEANDLLARDLLRTLQLTPASRPTLVRA